MNRRELIKGAALLFAAPAIVRVGSLMPIKAERNLDQIIKLLEESNQQLLELFDLRFANSIIYGVSHPEQFSGLQGLIHAPQT